MDEHLLRPGAAVVTAQQKAIGRITGVATGRFEVSDGARAFWLRHDAVKGVAAGTIQLICDGQHLYQHVATPPALANVRR